MYLTNMAHIIIFMACDLPRRRCTAPTRRFLAGAAALHTFPAVAIRQPGNQFRPIKPPRRCDRVCQPWNSLQPKGSRLHLLYRVKASTRSQCSFTTFRVGEEAKDHLPNLDRWDGDRAGLCPIVSVVQLVRVGLSLAHYWHTFRLIKASTRYGRAAPKHLVFYQYNTRSCNYLWSANR